jgi:DNA-binding MarR family transcriptional regulator
MSVATTYGADQEVLFTAGIRLLARLARVAERACQETGVSLPQYRILVSISGRPLRASELAAHVGVSRPTLTSLVDGLEQSGLLRRRPVPTDRRGIWLEPTEAGLQAVADAEHVLAQRLLELVDREDVTIVGDVVGALGAALDRERTVRVSAGA